MNLRQRSTRSVPAAAFAVLALALLAGGCTRPGRGSTTQPSTTTTAATTPDGSSTTTGPTDVSCVGMLAGPTTEAYRTVPGVRANLLSLDVYRRSGATGCPAIVWVHGGGWRQGDKQGNAISTKASYAGGLGAVLVSVNYRLAAPDNDVRWPTFGEDVAAAVDWVITNAAELGIDPTRVVLMGHSAGAHLASIVGTNPSLLGAFGKERSAVRCVVSVDSAAYDLRNLVDDEDEVFFGAFGNDPATIFDASPTLQAAAHPGVMPSFLAVTRGSPRRVAVVQTFADTVTAGGSTAHVFNANPYSHEQVNTQLGRPGEQLVTPPVTAFLSTCFA